MKYGGRYWVELRGGVLVFSSHHGQLEAALACADWLHRQTGKRVELRERPPEGWTVEDEAEVLTIDAQHDGRQRAFSLVWEAVSR